VAQNPGYAWVSWSVPAVGWGGNPRNQGHCDLSSPVVSMSLWERVRAGLEVWTPILAPWFVPITVAIVGLLINSTVAASQTSADYVRLATEILSSGGPTTGDEDVALVDQALRSWAVDVFKANSPIPLGEGLEDGLRSGQLIFGWDPLPAGSDGPLPDGQCVLTVNVDQTVVYAQASPVSQEVAELDSGSEPEAFELRTFRPTGQQFVRVPEGWVEFFPFFTSLDCGDFDPSAPPTSTG